MRRSTQPMESRTTQFERLSSQHMNGLRRLALRFANNPEDAEDLLQDTYLKGLEHFDQFRPGTNFRAWIYTILRNTFFNQYRKSKETVTYYVTVQVQVGTTTEGRTIFEDAEGRPVSERSITVNDARRCVLQCSNPRCSP